MSTITIRIVDTRTAAAHWGRGGRVDARRLPVVLQQSTKLEYIEEWSTVAQPGDWTLSHEKNASVFNYPFYEYRIHESPPTNS